MSEQMEYSTNIDGAVERYEVAYAAHRRMYEMRVPQPPIKPFEQIAERPAPVAVKGENRLTLAILGVMVLAAVIVSGSRTVPEFGGGVIGFAAFAMIEVGLVAFAFIRTRTDYDEAKHAKVKRLVNLGMWMAFVIATAANLHATLKHGGVELAGWIDTLILGILAISAPVLAFISGDVMGMYSAMDASRQRKADKEYEQRFKEWNAARLEHERGHDAAIEQWRDGLNSSWNAAKKNMGVSIRVEREAPVLPQKPVHSLNSLNEPVNERDTNGYSVNSPNEYTKRMDARSVIQDFFTTHPERLNEKLDVLVDDIRAETGVKVGRTSVHNVRKEMQG